MNSFNVINFLNNTLVMFHKFWNVYFNFIKFNVFLKISLGLALWPIDCLDMSYPIVLRFSGYLSIINFGFDSIVTKEHANGNILFPLFCILKFVLWTGICSILVYILLTFEEKVYSTVLEGHILKMFIRSFRLIVLLSSSIFLLVFWLVVPSIVEKELVMSL